MENGRSMWPKMTSTDSYKLLSDLIPKFLELRSRAKTKAQLKVGNDTVFSDDDSINIST
jgi:hypothetical protein